MRSNWRLVAARFLGPINGRHPIGETDSSGEENAQNYTGNKQNFPELFHSDPSVSMICYGPPQKVRPILTEDEKRDKVFQRCVRRGRRRRVISSFLLLFSLVSSPVSVKASEVLSAQALISPAPLFSFWLRRRRGHGAGLRLQPSPSSLLGRACGLAAAAGGGSLAAALAARPRRGAGGGGGGGGANGFRYFKRSVRERSLPSSSSMKTSCASLGYLGNCGVISSSVISGSGRLLLHLAPLGEIVLDLLFDRLLLGGHREEQHHLRAR